LDVLIFQKFSGFCFNKNKNIKNCIKAPSDAKCFEENFFAFKIMKDEVENNIWPSTAKRPF